MVQTDGRWEVSKLEEDATTVTSFGGPQTFE
jgi:hypothetical protein